MSGWGTPSPGIAAPLAERLHRAWHRNNLETVVGHRGLVLEHGPDHVVSGDIMELLHCLHDDIRAAHFAFRHVHRLESEMTAIKIIHKKQQYAYSAALAAQEARSAEQINLNRESVIAFEAATRTIRERDHAITAIIESTRGLTQAVSQECQAIAALEERLRSIETPWWRKILARLRRAM